MGLASSRVCNAQRAVIGQFGVIYRIGGVLAGLDLLGSQAVFARAFPKLVRGSALQALQYYGAVGGGGLEC